MNENLEMEFIAKCIKKEKQERLQYELRSKNKRMTAIMRFSHNVEEMLNKHLIILSSESFTITDIDQIIGKKNCSQDCYLIGTDFDGNTVKYSDAIKICYEEYMPSILILKDYVFIKEETEVGSPMKFILKIN